MQSFQLCPLPRKRKEIGVTIDAARAVEIAITWCSKLSTFDLALGRESVQFPGSVECGSRKEALGVNLIGLNTRL